MLVNILKLVFRNKQTNKKPWPVIFASFCGANIPTTANFRLPLWCHWMQWCQWFEKRYIVTQENSYIYWFIIKGYHSWLAKWKRWHIARCRGRRCWASIPSLGIPLSQHFHVFANSETIQISWFKSFCDPVSSSSSLLSKWGDGAEGIYPLITWYVWSFWDQLSFWSYLEAPA